MSNYNYSEYDEFMKEYKAKRKFCPKCMHDIYTTTLVCYVLNLDEKEKYKDLNKCICEKCGNIHTFHDRVGV